MFAEKKRTDYRIVISAENNTATQYAAAELAKYLWKITGATFSVVTDETAAQEKEIVLGKTNRQGPCACELKNDGYILKTVGEKLFIAGSNDRGNLYGVYGLLEKYFGVRFLDHETEIVPAQEKVALPGLDETVVSPLEYRETYWYEPETYPEFAYKRGFNASLKSEIPEYLGGSIKALSLCHTFFSFLSPDDCFDEHPEYFSMVNGQRIRFESQLCLTNPDVKRIVKENLRKTILDHPECRIFSVSQMDWYNPCQCPECAKVDGEEGSHMGTVLRFVNECADSVAEEFPNVLIETLAYQYTRTPPKITVPRPNVLICLCTIECCFTHPMRGCHVPVRPFKYLVDYDHPIQDDMVAWGKICKRLLIWDYTTNYRFYLAPMVNLHVLQDNMKFFLENGTTCLFEQGNAQAKSGEFGELRAYLISKLMWEPDGNVSQWMDEFLAGYYGGKAAKPIRAYIDYLADHVTRHQVHAGIYESPMDVIPNNMIPQMDAFWDEAEAVTTDPKQMAHVRRSRLQVKYVKQHRRRAGDANFKEEGEKLIAEIRRADLEYIQESAPREMSFAQIRTGFEPDSWASFWKPMPVSKEPEVF